VAVGSGYIPVAIIAGLAAGLTRLNVRPARVPYALTSRRGRVLARLRKVGRVLVQGFALASLLAVILVVMLNSVSLARDLNSSQFTDLSEIQEIVIAGTSLLFLLGLRRILGRPSGLAAPQMLVPQWPRRQELGWIIAAGLVFFPLLVPLLLSVWVTPVAGLPSATPSGTFRTDRRTSLIYALIYAAPCGVLAGLWAGLITGPLTDPVAQAFSGPTAGLIAGLGFGLAAGAAALLISWVMSGRIPLLKLTELLLIPRHRSRVKFIPLLEDASGRQVLRQAGAVYQFRHAALQSRLAAMYHQPPAKSKKRRS
jgi:hypothetical protein